MRIVLWALIALYAIARCLQPFPNHVPMLLIVALHVFPPALFALIHGAVSYRPRGIAVFVVLCLAVGNGFENLSVATGFPFGHYYFTDVMGPRILRVPILLGLAYVGMGYLSWMLARVMLGETGRPLAGSRMLILPLLASFVMVAWDLSMDPVWSTMVHAWIWIGGGAWFGVPVSNFLGWFLAVYVIYQLFALYLGDRLLDSPGYSRLPVIFYGISAAGNLLLLSTAGPAVVTDALGMPWKVGSIVGASALISIFVMGAFTLLAWARLRENSHG
jgi:putative membrane protein